MAEREQYRDWWSGRLAGGDDRRVKEVRWDQRKSWRQSRAFVYYQVDYIDQWSLSPINLCAYSYDEVGGFLFIYLFILVVIMHERSWQSVNINELDFPLRVRRQKLSCWFFPWRQLYLVKEMPPEGFISNWESTHFVVRLLLYLKWSMAADIKEKYSDGELETQKV